MTLTLILAGVAMACLLGGAIAIGLQPRAEDETVHRARQDADGDRP